MKRITTVLIMINQAIAFLALSVDTERTPFWGVMTCLGYFMLSFLLTAYADRKGLFNPLKSNQTTSL